MKLLNKPETLFDQAIEAHKLAHTRAREFVTYAFDSGIAFLGLNDLCKRGDFADLLRTRENEISPRTVYRYMQLATGALEWAREANPRMKDPHAVEKAAREIVHQSGLPLVELLRALDLVKSKESGGRANDKHKNASQMELAFDWTVFSDATWHLVHTGPDALKQVPTDALQESCTHIEKALHLAREELQSRRSAGALPSPGGEGQGEGGSARPEGPRAATSGFSLFLPSPEGNTPLDFPSAPQPQPNTSLQGGDQGDT